MQDMLPPQSSSTGGPEERLRDGTLLFSHVQVTTQLHRAVQHAREELDATLRDHFRAQMLELEERLCKFQHLEAETEKGMVQLSCFDGQDRPGVST